MMDLVEIKRRLLRGETLTHAEQLDLARHALRLKQRLIVCNVDLDIARVRAGYSKRRKSRVHQ